MSPHLDITLVFLSSSLTKYKFSGNHNDNTHRKERRERENPAETNDAQHNCSAITCSLMFSHCSRAAIGSCWPSPPSSYPGHGVLWCGISLWPVWVTSPSCAPSQLFVHLLAGRARGMERSLAQVKRCSATAKPSVCHQRYSLLNPKL